MSNALYKTNQDIPQDMLLGNLLFTNLIDMKIDENDLISIFQKNNIPETYVKKISKADAFRRATSSVKNRIIYIQDSSTGLLMKAKVEVDEVKSDCDGIKRILGFKAVDEKNEDVSYIPMGYISFDRTSEQVVYGIEPQYIQNNDVLGVFTDMSDNYTDWSVYHNKDTVRNIINRIISDTHPINLMPTGLCKFVPSSSQDMLYNLKEALSQMNQFNIGSNAKSNIVEIIPVIDTHEQRSLIEKNFSAEITDELFEFTKKIKNVLTQKQSLSVRSATAYIEKFNLLNAKAKEYESLLGIYVDGIHQQITDSLDLVNDNTDV